MRRFPSIFSSRHGLLAGLILLMGLLGLFSMTAVRAQESTPVSTADPAVSSTVSADEINTVARELWCPLCSGVRLDACELKACQQMKEMIGIKLAAGEDTDAIQSYFVAQYGPQVLGQPTWQGINWLAWVLPFVVLAIGGYFMWHTVRRMVRPAPTTSPATTSASASSPVDEYDNKLAEELKRYG